MSDSRPYSDPCERNKEPILKVLREEFRATADVLEIGSGTGQHAVHFAPRLPHLVWHTSDLEENHAGIRAWIEEALMAQPEMKNLRSPLLLDVRERPWPIAGVDAIFSSNAVHIMSWPEVEKMFDGIGDVLAEGGKVCLYGPFNYGGRYTSESNASFDEWLHERSPVSGIRNFEDLDRLASQIGMKLTADHEMPANNRILVWKRS